MSTTKTIPAQAYLSTGTVRTFAEPEGGEPKESERFEMLLYSGAEVPTLFGDRMIIDLSGMKPRTEVSDIAILREHNRERVVGVCEDYAVGDELKLKGRMLTTPEGALICDEQAQGVRFQSSMGVRFLAVEELGEDSTREVNGREFSGPGMIVTESELMEGSFCVLGRDRNTSARVFSFADESAGTLEVKMAAEDRKDGDAAVAKGGAADFLAAFPGHEKFALEQLSKGASLAEAKGAFADVLLSENQQLRDKQAELAKENADLRTVRKASGVDFGAPAENLAAAKVAEEKPVDESMLTVEELSERHWKERPELRGEFTSQDHYTAYLRCEREWRIGISAPGLA